MQRVILQLNTPGVSFDFALSKAALWYRKPASAGTSLDSCGAQDSDKRNVLYRALHVSYYVLYLRADCLKMAINTSRNTSQQQTMSLNKLILYYEYPALMTKYSVKTQLPTN